MPGKILTLQIWDSHITICSGLQGRFTHVEQRVMLVTEVSENSDTISKLGGALVRTD